MSEKELDKLHKELTGILNQILNLICISQNFNNRIEKITDHMFAMTREIEILQDSINKISNEMKKLQEQRKGIEQKIIKIRKENE